MAEFRVTFGQQYRLERHPWSLVIHPDGWVTVVADGWDAAQEVVTDAFGTAWGFVYPADDFDAGLYPRGEVARLVAPAAGTTGRESDG